MFNDRFKLTQAVIAGKKTQTRRIANLCLPDDLSHYDPAFLQSYSPLSQGETVAVAMRYETCSQMARQNMLPTTTPAVDWESLSNTPGWANKMFTKASLMPFHIRLLALRLERLQSVSDDDCFRDVPIYMINDKYYDTLGGKHNTPQEAFGALFNAISGKPIWKTNPWVWVYDIEVVEKVEGISL